MPKLFILFTCLMISFFAHSQSHESDYVISIIERAKGIPYVLIERDGILYSLGNRGDSLIENRKLNIHVMIPKGLRPESFEDFILKNAMEWGWNVKSILFLRIIYFDSNSDLIRNDASSELDKFAALMSRYPFAQTQVIVHSDSRGSSSYNQKLALKRADSIKKYLTDAEVLNDNIQFKISGEDELEVDCANDVNCDEVLHQNNRRAEFIFNPIPK